MYVATQVTDVVETGLELVRFVGELLGQRLERGEQVAVWQVEGDQGPRVVAVLYPDHRGQTVVRWL